MTAATNRWETTLPPWLRLIVDDHLLLVVLDPAGRVISANRGFMAISWYSEAELVGRLFIDLANPEWLELDCPGAYSALRSGEPWRGELTRYHADGTPYWLNTTLIPIRDEAGELLQVVAGMHDLTPCKRMESELRDGRDRLEETVKLRTELLAEACDKAVRADHAKGEFLAVVSHELRTPLNGVLGFLELLLAAPLDHIQREYAQLAHNSGKNLLRLVNDILDFSKIEADKLTLEHVEFNLRDLVDDTILSLAPISHANGVELTGFIPKESPTLVRGDPGRLRQVIHNLVGNAIKFTPSGGSVEVYGGPVHRRGEVSEFMFEIRDTGVGIAPALRETIFQRFSQADSSASRRYGGAGLGLAISKRLVELMGGEIGVEENPYAKTGSVFHFTVQLETASETARPIPEVDVLSKGLRILVLDDDGIQLTLLDNFISDWDAKLVQAPNSETSLDLLAQGDATGNRYHLVVVNQRAGGGKSSIIARIITQFPAMRVILLTDLLDQGWDQTSILPGRLFCLRKPYTAQNIQDAIRLMLSQNPASGVLEPRNWGVETRGVAWKSSRVLVVDDYLPNLTLTKGMLIRLGCDPKQVETATDGESALEKVRSARYDLVLMDCQMPGLDGLQVARAIREWEAVRGLPPVPLVAFTADLTHRNQEECRAAQMNGFLGKPVSLDEMYKILVTFLEVHAVESHSPHILELDAVRLALSSIGLPEESMTEVAALLIDQIPELTASIAHDLQDGDFDSARAKSHVLKGSMANTIFPQLKDPTQLLHKQIRRKEVGDAILALEMVEQAFAPVLQALRRLLV